MRASEKALVLARRVLEIEAAAVSALASRVDAGFLHALDIVLACRGRVVVSGIGKSGHIARKIASTMASTGTPAFFVHPAEAMHGDLGMITRDDVLVALSYSGETEELLRIVPVVRRQGARLIVITGNPHSALAREADALLDASVAEEACPLGLAPTASTTAALAFGDALAVALLDARGFGPEDFARSHPGGKLGLRLLTHVSDVMRTGEALPLVAPTATLSAVIVEVSRKGMGLALVVDDRQKLLGVFTDGDLRRLMMSRTPNAVHALTAGEAMTPSPLESRHSLRPDHSNRPLRSCVESSDVNGCVMPHSHCEREAIGKSPPRLSPGFTQCSAHKVRPRNWLDGDERVWVSHF